MCTQHEAQTEGRIHAEHFCIHARDRKKPHLFLLNTPGGAAPRTCQTERSREKILQACDMPLALSPSPARTLTTESLLRGVDHVEEAVFVALLLVDLRDGCGDTDHAVLVDQEEEGLCRVKLESTSTGRETRKDLSNVENTTPLLNTGMIYPGTGVELITGLLF